MPPEAVRERLASRQQHAAGTDPSAPHRPVGYEVRCACGAHVRSDTVDGAVRGYIRHAYAVHGRTVPVSAARELVDRLAPESAAPEPHERCGGEVYRLDEGPY